MVLHLHKQQGKNLTLKEVITILEHHNINATMKRTDHLTLEITIKFKKSYLQSTVTNYEDIAYFLLDELSDELSDDDMGTLHHYIFELKDSVEMRKEMRREFAKLSHLVTQFTEFLYLAPKE